MMEQVCSACFVRLPFECFGRCGPKQILANQMMAPLTTTFVSLTHGISRVVPLRASCFRRTTTPVVQNARSELCQHEADMCCRLCVVDHTARIAIVQAPPQTRRCWICSAGANGIRGSVVSPQQRGKNGLYHCVRCRHFLEGLVWWYASAHGRLAKDNKDHFISQVLTKIDACSHSEFSQDRDMICPRLTHTVSHCLPDGDGVGSECPREHHLLRGGNQCQFHRFFRSLQYFDLSCINQRTYNKSTPSDRKTRRMKFTQNGKWPSDESDDESPSKGTDRDRPREDSSAPYAAPRLIPRQDSVPRIMPKVTDSAAGTSATLAALCSAASDAAQPSATSTLRYPPLAQSAQLTFSAQSMSSPKLESPKIDLQEVLARLQRIQEKLGPEPSPAAQEKPVPKMDARSSERRPTESVAPTPNSASAARIGGSASYSTSNKPFQQSSSAQPAPSTPLSQSTTSVAPGKPSTIATATTPSTTASLPSTSSPTLPALLASTIAAQPTLSSFTNQPNGTPSLPMMMPHPLMNPLPAMIMQQSTPLLLQQSTPLMQPMLNNNQLPAMLPPAMMAPGPWRMPFPGSMPVFGSPFAPFAPSMLLPSLQPFAGNAMSLDFAIPNFAPAQNAVFPGFGASL
eukprot:m.681396 g.681396  ORF g.681396 m.681396 type:complete len:627 (-) comp58599_c0_seq3:163-2043(-)